ncbi:hypothetical protein GIB67_035910 [Kingdonia uniflora]|uniref:Uncharacterized protein n=1 Tax=Kingdonia uniflora TaxID=39325 RepID=A0A7J7P8X5_9MAGN|nr:hypothetical protein GIB67_035910 [Kingdonia uniflora]
MATTTPAKIGTKGTVGSLVLQEMEYFSKLELNHHEKRSQKPQVQTSTDCSSINGGSGSKLGSVVVPSRRKRKKKKGGSGFLPSMCSAVEVADTRNKINQDLTMSSVEEEYDGTDDEDEFESDEAGWIEAQHYIVGHHVEYDAYWRHVSHGALMSDITRCGNIDIPGFDTLTARVTFPHVEFPTGNFSTQETQIPPLRLGDYPGWIMELGSPYGTTWHTIPSIVTTSTVDVPIEYDFFAMTEGMQKLTLDMTLDLEARRLHDQSCITHLTTNLRRTEYRLSQLKDYLNGEGVVVDWEDDEGKAKTSQAGTSRGFKWEGFAGKDISRWGRSSPTIKMYTGIF